MKVTEGHWNLQFDDATKAQSIEIGRRLADQLFNREVLSRISKVLSNQHKYFRWGTENQLGLSLLAGYLDENFPGERFDHIAYLNLMDAARGVSADRPTNISLSRGLAGLGLAAERLSCNHTRYQKLIANINGTLDEIVPIQCAKVLSQIGMCSSDFDVVSGLSGTGAYLLLRQDAVSCISLKSIIETLVVLAAEKPGVIRFHTPRAMISEFFPVSDHHKNGLIDCGLAHGVPGPLTMLALALKAGCKVPGIEEAIDTLASWLLARANEDCKWPAAVGIHAERDSEESSRDAWCYGTPGVARSLWLAGEAVGEDRYKETAISSMKAALARTNGERFTLDCCFCHGLAGLLQTTCRFYHDCGDEFFREQAIRLLQEILSCFDSENTFGFKSFSNEKWIDDPRLFEGATGIALAVLSATSPVTPDWDRFFLLS